MGYDFEVGKSYRIKQEKLECPWPCKPAPDRTITLFNDDVLTRSPDGTYMKHTGLGCFGIVINEDDVTEVTEPTKLRMM